jgi:hypothetical protein
MPPRPRRFTRSGARPRPRGNAKDGKKAPHKRSRARLLAGRGSRFYAEKDGEILIR